MAGHYQIFSRCDLLSYDSFEQVCIDRIKSRQGLVKNYQFWVGDKSYHKLNLLLITFRKLIRQLRLKCLLLFYCPDLFAFPQSRGFFCLRV